MKKTWGVGMMMLLPLTLQAMEGDESFKTTLKNRPPSHKRSLARSPTTTDFKQYNLQDMSEPVEVTKESVEVIKVELLPTPKQGPKTSKRGGATKNNSLLKNLLMKQYMQKILDMEKEQKQHEESLGEGVVLENSSVVEDSSVLGESLVRLSSPDFTREKN